ncbi:MFS transporter [Streptomyces sp. NPDC058247]|uniref:MFS transporter n=1 Tax=Streptomyces sp. NPDC058247 TaxID=3346401 RepID=UPI0036E96AC5
MANHAVHSRFPAEKRALPAGVVAAGASLGPLLMAPILTWVIVRWSWLAAFGVLAVAGTIWAVLWLTFGKDAPDASAASQATESEVVDAPFTTLVKSGTLIGVALLTFFGYWSTTLKIVRLPILVVPPGVPRRSAASGALTPFPVCRSGRVTWGRRRAGRAGRRRNRRRSVPHRAGR